MSAIFYDFAIKAQVLAIDIGQKSEELTAEAQRRGTE